MSEIAFAVRGFLTVRRSSLRIPLRGSLAIRAEPGSGLFAGHLTLDRSKFTRTVLGASILAAEVQITAESLVVGQVDPEGRLFAAVAVGAVIDSLQVGGRTAISDGNCRTAQQAVVPLRSRPGFDLERGGRLTGSYCRPPFTGGGWVTPLINLVAAGPGNAVAIDLIPAQDAAG
jgi:hypothetical protein